MANPALAEDECLQLVADFMRASRAVAAALCSKNPDAERLARQAVALTKRALGERGPVWWNDCAPDCNGA